MIALENVKKHEKSLVFITLIMAFFGLALNYVDEQYASRLLRVVISVIFFSYFICVHKQKSSTLLALFFLLYISSNVLAIWYELQFIPSLMISLMSVSVTALVLYLFPKIKGVKINSAFKIMLTIIVIINLFLLIGLIEAIKEKNITDKLYIIMILFVFLVCIMSFTTLLFNYHKSSKASIIFTAFWFTVVFSEVFRAMGHYDLAYGKLSIYLEQFLFCISSGLLVYYSILNLQEKEQKSDAFKYL